MNSMDISLFIYFRTDTFISVFCPPCLQMVNRQESEMIRFDLLLLLLFN
jgi:hypothetical protein